MDYLIVPYPDFRLGDIIDPDQFDANNEFVELKVNEMVDSINLFLSANGASNLGIVPKAPFTQASIQAYLDEFITYLNNATGASYIGAVPSGDNTGTTIQTQLDYINTLLKGEFVKTASISNGAVTTPKIANQAITNEKLAPGSVTSDKMVANSVITANLTDASVTTPKIANQAVTPAKIQDYSIGNEKLLLEAVRTGNLAPGAVNASKIADRAVTSTKIGLREVKAENLDPALMEIVPITGINTRVGVLEDEMDVAQLGISLADSKIGDLTKLTTTNKESLTNAINEVNAKTQIATTAEAQAGTNNTKVMTPKTVGEAIANKASLLNVPNPDVFIKGYQGSTTRVFLQQFPNNNQYGNITFSFPKITFAGIMEVVITSQYAHSNAAGGAKITWHLGFDTNTIHSNQRDVVEVSELFANEYTVTTFFDSGTRYVFAIEKLTKLAANGLRIEVTFKGLGEADGPTLLLNGVEVSQVVSSLPTTTPRLVSIHNGKVSKSGDTMTGNLKIDNGIPNLSLADSTIGSEFNITYNRSATNDYGIQFRKDTLPFMVVRGDKDIVFYYTDGSIFTIQQLKESTLSLDAKITNKITAQATTPTTAIANGTFVGVYV